MTADQAPERVGGDVAGDLRVLLQAPERIRVPVSSERDVEPQAMTFAHELVGFVNVAWDGGVHAFLLDTMVSQRVGRQGIGTRLVEVAVAEARATACEWLHVDFDDHLRAFYSEACRFTPVNAGLIRLA